jgi:RND superfamily putative drug exporter
MWLALAVRSDQNVTSLHHAGVVASSPSGHACHGRVAGGWRSGPERRTLPPIIMNILLALLRRPRTVVCVWALIAACAAVTAPLAVGRLSGGGGTLAPTEAARAEQLVRTRFDRPATDLLLVAFEAAAPATGGLVADEASRSLLLDSLTSALQREPWVRSVRSFRTDGDSLFLARDGRAGLLVVLLGVPSMDSGVRLVPRARTVVEGAVAAAGAAPWRVHVTGEYAMDLDTRTVSERDGQRIEVRILPVTLTVLVVAFGAVVAAALPVVVGVLSIWVSLAIIAVLATAMPLSIFVLNLTTMIGLGVGIDYSLLLVTRFRTERCRSSPIEALERTLQTAGEAVLSSGMIVMIGFAALMATPLVETRSVGVGGVIVVAVAMLLAVTLLPALLLLLGPQIDGPAWLSSRMTLGAGRRLACRWSELVAARPWSALVVGGATMLLLAWPVRHLHIGLPSRHWWPAGTEAAAGARILGNMGVTNLGQPVRVVVDVPEGESVVRGVHLRGLRRLSDRLAALPAVATVRSPVDLGSHASLLEYSLLYSDLEAARQRAPDYLGRVLSPDARVALLEVVAADTASLLTVMDLSRKVRAAVAVKPKGLETSTIAVGGFGATAVDLQALLMARFPIIVAAILGTTLLLLGITFRSVLVPIKAVILNSVSVAAAFGLLVRVFQDGRGGSLVGLDGPMDAVHAAVPVLVFAVVFGLSMDYEVFLLSRVREAYQRTGDNRAAVIEGLTESAGTITSAALIMVVVFGAFSFARVAAIQLLGFGLATAVFLDATVVRMLLVPALMHLAGRWNWWPGRPRG